MSRSRRRDASLCSAREHAAGGVPHTEKPSPRAGSRAPTRRSPQAPPHVAHRPQAGASVSPRPEVSGLMRTDRFAPHCAYPHAARTPFFGWPHARRAGRSPQTKSGRLCAVRMAPVAVQPVVASTLSSSASIPSGSTVISRRRLLPDSSRRARITSRLVTAMMLTTSSLKAHSPVNAAVGGARSGCALVHGPVERTLHRAPTVNDGRLVCSIRPCRCLALSRWF